MQIITGDYTVMTIVIDTDVVIVGRNEIVREGLSRILAGEGFTVMAAVPEYTLVVRGGDGAMPQLIIVDADNSNDCIDHCALLRSAFPDSRLVLMADGYEMELVSRAFAAGVDGYLAKAISCAPLIGALKLIMMGEKLVPSQVVLAMTSMRANASRIDFYTTRIASDLTDREMEIVGHLVHGESNKLIARRLTVSEATVKAHVKAILRKLQLSNRTQAAIWAVNERMIAA